LMKGWHRAMSMHLEETSEGGNIRFGDKFGEKFGENSEIIPDRPLGD